jgi:hypothetical protein
LIAIFLNNKLISCDTIVPVLLEVRERSRQSIGFYTTDPVSFDAIRQNIVLSDAIDSVGALHLLGRRRKGVLAWIQGRFSLAFTLLTLIAMSWLGRVRFIHFRALNEGPLRILRRLNLKNTFFCQSNSFPKSELVTRIDDLGGARKRNENPPSSGSVVGFAPESQIFDTEMARQAHRFVFTTPRLRKPWLDFVRANEQKYFNAAFREASIPDSPEILVYMLGYLKKIDFMRSEESPVRLFRETLATLVEVAGDRPIFIKPHIISDIDLVRSEVARFPEATIVITHLHPSILATRAKVFVSNYFSTTQADAHCLGVPTVEFADYSDEALEVTDGGSMYPQFIDYFIQDDPQKLREVLRDLDKRPSGELPPGETQDPDGWIDALVSK